MKQQQTDEYEEDYFQDDDRRSILIRGIAGICVFLLLIAGICVGVLSARKKDSAEDLQDSIRQNAEMTTGEESVSAEEDPIEEEQTVFARNEEKAAPEPTATPELIATPEPEKPVMEEPQKDYSKISFDARRNLSEMEGYFRDDNNEALWDLSHLDRYIAMSYSLRDTTDYLYYGDVNASGQPEGKGIAVYADNEYYYGEWKGGVREGGGKWIHYHIHFKETTSDLIYHHSFTGTFANDLPNGAGQDHYEYNTELLKSGEYYITNYICSYRDGLIDGDIYATTTTGGSGQYFDWIGTAANGSFDFISEARDKNKRGPVMTDRENPDNYFWLSEAENQKIGVKNYISEKRSEK